MRLPALAMREGYEPRHHERVASLSARVARRLGLDEQVARQVALLRSIGRLTLSASILDRRGPLDDLDWATVRAHPLAGELIVASAHDDAALSLSARAAYERWDGRGYPDGLAGEAIPWPARVSFPCEAFFAMLSPRPYRPALSIARAVEEIAVGAGMQFCPASSDALMSVLAHDGVGELWEPSTDLRVSRPVTDGDVRGGRRSIARPAARRGRKAATVEPGARDHAAAHAILEHLGRVTGFALWALTSVEGEEQRVVEVVDAAFGVTQGMTLRFADSLCAPMAARQGPAYAPDVACVPAYADCPQTKEMGVGAYMGLPIRDADGILRGTLCGLDPEPQPPELAEELCTVRLMGESLALVLARERAADTGLAELAGA